MIFPTVEQILDAQAQIQNKYFFSESMDSVRIAYAWLDAQKKNKTCSERITLPLKHIIESWGGRYVSKDDVVVAALLHPDIKGSYPRFNISARLIKPHTGRLSGIAEAGLHPAYMQKHKEAYSAEEVSYVAN